MANKTLYIDMDGTLTEFRHQDKICINDWNDTTIFENPEICTSTILGIKLTMDFQEEHFTNIDFIYIITQVPYTNYKIHIKHKQDTYNILYDLFKKKYPYSKMNIEFFKISTRYNFQTSYYKQAYQELRKNKINKLIK